MFVFRQFFNANIESRSEKINARESEVLNVISELSDGKKIKAENKKRRRNYSIKRISEVIGADKKWLKCLRQSTYKICTRSFRGVAKRCKISEKIGLIKV